MYIHINVQMFNVLLGNDHARRLWDDVRSIIMPKVVGIKIFLSCSFDSLNSEHLTNNQ